MKRLHLPLVFAMLSAIAAALAAILQSRLFEVMTVGIASAAPADIDTQSLWLVSGATTAATITAAIAAGIYVRMHRRERERGGA